MLTVAFLSYKLADKELLKSNEFNFEPIKEVAFHFYRNLWYNDAGTGISG